MKDGYARNNSLVRGRLESYWKSVRRIQEEVELMKVWFWGSRTGGSFVHKAQPGRRHRIIAEKVQ